MRQGQKISTVARYIGSSIKRGRLGTSIAALETTASKRPFTFNRSSAETKSPHDHRLRSAHTPLPIKPAHECLLVALSGHRSDIFTTLRQALVMGRSNVRSDHLRRRRC